jgi:DHA1 family bicyclomycin/chloramphenicol resistance-like MFS transporter
MTSPRRLSEKEFIALCAMLFATIAVSIDAMLPALTAMGLELTPNDPGQITLVVSTFLLGMGVGTFVTGPLSDAFGRKPVILGGYAVFVVGALMSAMSGNLEWVLVGRFIQGLGVSGPRIATLALVRDLYSGERMAAIQSFVMTVFMLVPAFAPMFGQIVIEFFGWRAIFLTFILFSAAVSVWLAVRQPETLASDQRVPLSAKALISATRECFGNRIFIYSVTVLTLTFTGLFAMISTIQQIYAQFYGAEDTFPFWFAGSALLAVPAGIINGRLVMRFGMRILIKTALLAQTVVSVAALAILLSGQMSIEVFFLWAAFFMFNTGFTIGNLTALALEPMGHIAGLAASVNGAVSTVASGLLAIPIGLAFDGTPRALVVGVILFYALGYLLMLRLGPRPVPDLA